MVVVAGTPIPMLVAVLSVLLEHGLSDGRNGLARIEPIYDPLASVLEMPAQPKPEIARGPGPGVMREIELVQEKVPATLGGHAIDPRSN